MDERIAITVVRLPPGRKVTIRARSSDCSGQRWSSSAVFVVRPDGSLDLSAQAPNSGTYRGVDAMGLFWSMGPENGKPGFFEQVDFWKPVVTEVEAVVGAQVIAGAQVTRHFAGPGVRAEAWRRDGLAGTLYRPADDRPHRGVILLGGSEGGLPGPVSVMLASRGFVVLALAYFGTSGLPASMQRIPIEYFGKAIHGLMVLPGVQGVTLMGTSRGTEAALIAGAAYPDVNGVVAISPSHVRWEGATARELPGGPAWTWRGEPLPYVRFHLDAGFVARFLWGRLTGRAVALKPMFLDSLGRAGNDGAQIAVEQIHGPILFVSGSDDRLWPSQWMSEQAMERLRRARHPYSDEHVVYAGAGHWIPSAYVPMGGLQGSMAGAIGGTPEAGAKALADWWPRLIRFLGR